MYALHRSLIFAVIAIVGGLSVWIRARRRWHRNEIRRKNRARWEKPEQRWQKATGQQATHAWDP